MKKRMRAVAVCISLLLCAGLLGGCAQSNIHEDAIREELPVLDPEAGVAQEVTVTRYYRLQNEGWLVGVTRAIPVRANERTEYAITRSLLSGAPADAENVESTFPAGTALVDISLDGDILYVTVSAAFLSEGELNKAQSDLQSALNTGRYTQAEYDEELKKAEERFYRQRALAVYSLVDTLTGYNEDIRVMFLVDVDGTGNGVRLPRGELGMEDTGNTESDLIEPMGFVSSVILTARGVAEAALDRLCAGEYTYAYLLFNRDKPTREQFQQELASMGELTGYHVNGMSGDEQGKTVYMNADLALTRSNGTQVIIPNALLSLRLEGDIYKVSYASYISILEER